MEKLTVRQAAEKWVREYINSFPQRMIAKLMQIEPYSWREVTQSGSEFYDVLPVWGTMWQFSDSIDTEWLAGRGGLKAMTDCGFRIFENDEFGYFFGIDGAGYDFYAEHWIPLYKARGLQWHITSEE